MHPDAAFGDVVHVALERYEAIHREMRGLVSRTPTAAVHVHVGMPDAETAITVCNGLRAHLPLLQALAAHSPYWHGEDSGLASARALRFRASRARRSRRPFDDWADYEALVEWCVATAEVDDYTYLWWDIRPSPNLGTVEVRAMDAQTRLEQRRRARRADPRARRGLRGRRGGAGTADGGAQGVLVPGRPRRRRRDDLVARRDAADTRGGRRRARAGPPVRA